MSSAIVGTINGRASSVSPETFRIGASRSIDSSNGGSSSKENKHHSNLVVAEEGKVEGPLEDNFALAKNPNDCVSSPPRRNNNNKVSEEEMVNLTPRTDAQDDHLQLDTVSILSHQSSVDSSVVGVGLIDTPTQDTLTNLYYEPNKQQVSQQHQYPYILPSSSSISSKGSELNELTTTTNTTTNNNNNTIPLVLSNANPDQDEQAMFEHRLCEDEYGVAVRKVASNGKGQLRYVKCVFMRLKDKIKSDAASLRSEDSLSFYNMNQAQEELNRSHQPSLGSKSASSIIHRMKLRKSKNSSDEVLDNISKVQNRYQRALIWGNKKRVKIPLDKFVAVRKGKTTDRTRRNYCSSARLLSIITKDRRNPSLDIEAPTRVDRDKFATAFAIFLNVPLEEDPDARTDTSAASMNMLQTNKQAGRKLSKRPISAAHTEPGDAEFLTPLSISSSSISSSVRTPQQIGKIQCGDLLPAISPSHGSTDADMNLAFESKSPPKMPNLKEAKIKKTTSSRTSSKNSDQILSDAAMKRVMDTGPDIHILPSQSQVETAQPVNTNHDSQNQKETHQRKGKNKAEGPTQVEDKDANSEVSSLTQGYDQEIVDELHNAINELRAELNASRAEAARAVKVAEQAIQSAESCSSNDWNNTVTHKAAEAAAQAQKRSAEAMARQRLAEERLVAEKKSAMFWRKQAEAAEDEIGSLLTRYAAAEIHRAKVSEEITRERKASSTYINSLKRDFSMGEKIQRETIAGAAERNRLLEIELDSTRRDLVNAECGQKGLQEYISELKSGDAELGRSNSKKKFFGLPKKQKNSRGPSLLTNPNTSSTSDFADETPTKKIISDDTKDELLLKLHAEAAATRKQFDLLRRSTVDEVRSLPQQAKEWTEQVTRVLALATKDNESLRMAFAAERANRRKLLNEVQDLRGTVRVYCRPAPQKGGNDSIISTPSNELCLLHREKLMGSVDVNNKTIHPLSYEFDRVFDSRCSQTEVYNEMEELILSALDGYNICIMAFGQSGSGKTRTLIGEYSVNFSNQTDVLPDVEIQEDGMHFLAAQQLFTIADRRKDRYQDSFSITIVEVWNEKLRDLVVDTNIVKQKNGGTKEDETDGKLEIRTNYDGDTIVQGLVSIPVNNFEDVEQVWNETLAARAHRCQEQGINLKSLENASHVIATIQVVSTNIASGVGTVGKIQFVDLAGADLVRTKDPSSSNEFKFENKSLSTLNDVVSARSQFTRKVPYRNSTLTHLLRDSLEADTKMLCIVCINSNKKHIEETACALRFASQIKKVVIGKATKHTVSLA